MLRHYYALTKPGIVYGNAVSVVAGFLLASQGAVDLGLLVATLLGISFIIASGCVFNNYIDRDIDGLMERTKKRALVRGDVSTRGALLYGACLGLLGALTLFVFTTVVATAVGLFGLFVYVFVYSLWSKRHTIHSTVLGAIAGAVPPVVGYAAVSGTLDAAALMLFIILAIWQMPHALAIAIYRYKDYAAASIPVLPVAKGILGTKIVIALSAAAFIPATLSLYLFGYTGVYYAFGMLTLSLVWLIICVRGFTVADDTRWAKTVFRTSLLILLVATMLIGVDVRA